MHKVLFSRLLAPLLVLPLLSLEAATDPRLDPNIPRVAMGDGLYNQKGANSCLHCHGPGGVGGSVKVAANLQQPKNWKIYRILGGDAAFAKDPAAFRQKMKEATTHLILKGAIMHNSSFKRPWFDISKAGSPYDGQMIGLTGAPSQGWLKKYKAKYGVKPEVASESLYLYLQTISKQDVL